MTNIASKPKKWLSDRDRHREMRLQLERLIGEPRQARLEHLHRFIGA